MLTALNRLTENIFVKPVVISELELGNVERQVLMRDFVERPDHAALNEGPETFDGIGMHRADNIFAPAMIDARMWVGGVEFVVASPLIGTKQTDFRGNSLAGKLGKRTGLDILDDTRNDAALARDSAAARTVGELLELIA